MRVVIETIPHNDHRYETVGDWIIQENGDVVIQVSDLGDWRHEILVGIHELVEVVLCKARSISDDAVTAFDTAFEKKRGADDIREPGDERDAPYQNEHCVATGIERMLCATLGIKWADYEAAVMAA